MAAPRCLPDQPHAADARGASKDRDGYVVLVGVGETLLIHRAESTRALPFSFAQTLRVKLWGRGGSVCCSLRSPYVGG